MTERPLEIVADAGIPGIEAAMAPFGPVRAIPGPALGPEDVRNADVLVVRSVTRVDRMLLSGSAVRFVASATAGIDHVDTDWLRANEIGFAHAPGANAASVGDYVIAALIHLAAKTGRPLKGRTMGVVGCGAVGGRLVPRLQALGLQVLENDPPREAQSGETGFVSLDTILAQADIVTSHVPLTREGDFPTYHLFGPRELASMRPDSWLINTARGAVVSNQALLPEVESGRITAVLDVWEGEPRPDPRLISGAALATPHIAGYAIDSKDAATRAVVQAVAAFVDLEDAAPAAPRRPQLGLHLDPKLPLAQWLGAAVRAMYDVEADDRRLRESVSRPAGERAAAFDGMRRAYPERRLFAGYAIARGDVPASLHTAVGKGLGIQWID